MASTDWIRAARTGFELARPVERSAFGMSTGVVTSLVGARLVNYVRERRRPMPRLRSFGRRISGVPKDDSPRVHHFVPGLGLALTAGAGGIATREDVVGAVLSVPFGVGVGLTLDELGLLLDRPNAYWEAHSAALVGSGIASLISAALVGRFVATGHANP